MEFAREPDDRAFVVTAPRIGFQLDVLSHALNLVRRECFHEAAQDRGLDDPTHLENIPSQVPRRLGSICAALREELDDLLMRQPRKPRQHLPHAG